jgi:hypothetical protein
MGSIDAKLQRVARFGWVRSVAKVVAASLPFGIGAMTFIQGLSDEIPLSVIIALAMLALASCATPVISQTGMARILGLSARGNAFPRFVTSQALADSVGAELRAKVEKPLLIQWGSGGAEQPPSTIHGYDAKVLTEVCSAIARANAKGRLSAKRYKATAGVPVGRLNYCICPNGQAWREQNADLKAMAVNEYAARLAHHCNLKA